MNLYESSFGKVVVYLVVLPAIAQHNDRCAAQEGDFPSNATRVALVGPADTQGLDAYTLEECQRVLGEHRIAVQHSQDVEESKDNLIVIGTAKNNPLIAQLLKEGFLKAEHKQQGYAMRCAPHPRNSKVWLLAIAGADSHGALYGLRDLEHYESGRFKVIDGVLTVEPFARSDYPRIEHRGHWVWGCNMPDKKAWLENMSRWKMNELIHWDNYPPKKAKEYVEFAHSRGVRVVWGFGWGWNPDWNFSVPKEFDRGIGNGVLMCGSDDFNRAFFRREILRKIRDEYAPTGCDGVYFQSFTEGPKCRCNECRNKSMGKIMLDFVNPLVNEIKMEFPDLWISCGIHANFGVYGELKDLDPRCNIYWENCPSGVSVRGDDEDFGYINKTLPYGHGFSRTCPADPEFSDASLKEWMKSNAHRYALRGDVRSYYRYMQGLQKWGQAMLAKSSTRKHGSTVADHSVFCRRTPFMHVALTEAMWNPNLETEKSVDLIIAFLKAHDGLPGLSGPASRKQLDALAIAQHDAIGKSVTLATRYHSRYPGGGDQALTDGRRAVSTTAADKAWQGYHRQNLNAIIDLKKPTSINGLAAGFLHQPRAGVHLPHKVEFATSQDGKTFSVVGDVKQPADVKLNRRHAYGIDGLELYEVRYVRVRANYIKEWLMADEIMINPIHVNESR